MAKITDTGIRGFLEWFKQDQPAIYAKVAPMLPKVAPQAFSAYTRRAKTLKNIYKTGLSGRSPQRLGDYDCLTPIAYSSAYIDSPLPTCFVGNSATQFQMTCDIPPTYEELGTDVSGNTVVASSTCGTSSGGGNLASAANTGTAGVATTGAIGNAINSVAGTVLSAANAAQLAALVATQLNQAANGQSPKKVSSASLGIPVVKSNSTMGILLLLGLGGAALWALG